MEYTQYGSKTKHDRGDIPLLEMKYEVSDHSKDKSSKLCDSIKDTIETRLLRPRETTTLKFTTSTQVGHNRTQTMNKNAIKYTTTVLMTIQAITFGQEEYLLCTSNKNNGYVDTLIQDICQIVEDIHEKEEEEENGDKTTTYTRWVYPPRRRRATA